MTHLPFLGNVQFLNWKGVNPPPSLHPSHSLLRNYYFTAPSPPLPSTKIRYKNDKNDKNDKNYLETNKQRDRETERVAQQLNIFLYQASIISSHWIISFK